MKLKTAFCYRLKIQGISLGICFIFFLVFGCLFPIVSILSGKLTEPAVLNLTLWGFLYLVVISFIGNNGNFKWFMQNGMSRKNIFLVNLLTALFWSIGMIAIFGVFRLIFSNNLVPSFYLKYNVINLYKLNGFYQFLMLTLFFFFANTIGVFLGIFNDRFNYMVKLVTGLTAASIVALFVLSLKIFGTSFKTKSLHAFYQMIGYDNGSFHAANLAFTIFVITIVLLGVSFVMNQTRELKKIND